MEQARDSLVRILHKAQSIRVDQHLDIAAIREWPRPERDRRFLEYCEWLLWQNYNEYPLSYGGSFQAWMLGFYIKLATSPCIKEVCEDQCRSREHADGLLGLLYWESDRMTTDRPADDPVFGELLGRQIAKAQGLKLKEARKTARADLRQFAAMKAAIDRLSPQGGTCVRAELHEVVEKLEGQARSVIVPAPPGPTAISINGLVFAPDPPSDATSQSICRGRPAFDHASENTYLELVKRLVKKAYRGRDELEKAVAIVQHFSPGLLPNQYDANQLGSRLKPFSSKPGVSKYLKDLETHFVTRAAFTTLLRPLQS